jgi:multiple antibiotic resistance protein
MHLLQLIILFFVIIDPFASFVIFLTATEKMNNSERNRAAVLAVLIALLISFIVLIFGQNILNLLDTSIENFKVAGGIILSLLGIKMALGYSLTDSHLNKKESVNAIACLIATPLLTGPATITAIIISSEEYGMISTGIALLIVFLISAIILLLSSKLKKITGPTTIQILSTILGLVTLAWGVTFIRAGLGI